MELQNPTINVETSHEKPQNSRISGKSPTENLASEDLNSLVQQVSQLAKEMTSEIEKAIVGKQEKINQAVLALLCKGHILLEDIPGVGKTTLAKALAKTIGGDFKRIQFTPDMLPSDITGTSIYNQETTNFEFRPGPIFGNVVLADEINRATPKTQSALLEAMEEIQVTTDGESRKLPNPFFVLATQNSIEMTGTYPLPEAQMDRFFMRLSIGYPSRQAEAAILSGRITAQPLDSVGTVVTFEELDQAQKVIAKVFVHENIVGYIVDIIRATRESTSLVLGSSPRGSLHLMKAAQASAAMRGSTFVSPDDIKSVAPIILGHRVIARADGRIRMQDAGHEGIHAVITEIVNSVPVPTTGIN